MSKARGGTRKRLLSIGALMMTLMIIVWQGSAVAGLGEAGGKQSSASSAAVESDTSSTSAATDSVIDASQVTTTTASSAGQEEEAAPTGGASSVATVANVEVGGQEIITVSESSSNANDDGCGADVTLISILGQELSGSHAECAPGQETTDENGLLLESCEMSGGALCIALLYSRATASDDSESTEGSGQGDVASACAGGEQANPSENCSGPVGARVGHSESSSRRNKRNGESSAHQESSLVEVCLGGTDPETGICNGIGIVLLHSEGDGTARPGQDAEMSGESYIVGVEAQGETVTHVGPEVDIPTGCNDAENPDLCVSLNDGDTTVEAGSGSNHQEVVGLDVGDLATGSVDEGTVEADSTKKKLKKVNPPEPPKRPKPKKRPPILAGPTGPALATTGAGVVPALLFGLGLILLGARLMRRPEARRS